MAFNGQCSIVMVNLVGWKRMAEMQGQRPQARKGEERTQWKQEQFHEWGKGTAEAPGVGRYRGGSSRLPPSTPLPFFACQKARSRAELRKGRKTQQNIKRETLNLMQRDSKPRCGAKLSWNLKATLSEVSQR